MKLDIDHFMILPSSSSEDKILQCVANCKNLEFGHVMLSSNNISSLEIVSSKLSPDIKCRYIINLSPELGAQIPTTHTNIPIVGIQLEFNTIAENPDAHLIIRHFCNIAKANRMSLYVSKIKSSDIREFHRLYQTYADIVYVVADPDPKILNQTMSLWINETYPIYLILSMTDTILEEIEDPYIPYIALGSMNQAQNAMLDKKTIELPDKYLSRIGTHITMKTTRGNTNRPRW